MDDALRHGRLYGGAVFGPPAARLGLAFLTAGIISLFWFSEYGVLSVALTFGLFHVVFGASVGRRQTPSGPRPAITAVMSEPIKPGDIDAVIHERARLSIVSALAVAADDFNQLKEMLDLTDGNLSVHARTLEEAGYLAVTKSFQGRRPHTAMRLTTKGRKAFTRYLRTLSQIVERGNGNGEDSS